MMTDYKKIILLAAILVISGLYCLYFFNGFLGLSDGNDYAGLGRSIIRGDGFQLGHIYPLAFSFDENIPQPNNMWAPAYPVYLALWFLVFGPSDSTVLAATIFSLWLLVLAVYMVAGKIAGENWALLAAALMGLNQSMLATALEGSPEPLTAALLLFSVYMLISKKNRIAIMVSGVIFGLTVLTRYQIVVLALPVLIFLTDRKDHFTLAYQELPGFRQSCFHIAILRGVHQRYGASGLLLLYLSLLYPHVVLVCPGEFSILCFKEVYSGKPVFLLVDRGGIKFLRGGDLYIRVDQNKRFRRYKEAIHMVRRDIFAYSNRPVVT
jgi:hypothetical protein